MKITVGEDRVAGLVEVYHAGAWGTVCNDWDSNDWTRDVITTDTADFLCRQMGYTYGRVGIT